MQDTYYLLQALEEAKKGKGFCAPNPAVGAVAVKNNQIIARGYHHGAGKPHAEVECMSQFPQNTSGVTMYVTLEPCNHFGRTPPCVNAIIKHGISKVVYGMLDPNDTVRALCSDEILSNHYVQTACVHVPEIKEFYKSYVYWTQCHKPWVTVKWAQTLDAKNTRKYQYTHFTNQEALEFTHLSRKCADIILSTAQTILSDNAQFTARIDGAVYAKPLAIIDRQLSLQGSEKCFSFERPIFIFHDKSLIPTYQHKFVKFIPVEVTKQHINMESIFAMIAQMDFHDVWVEAGTKMMNELHQKGLVNTSHIYIAPLVFGHAGINAYDEGRFNLLKVPNDVQWTPMGNNVRATINW